MAVDTSSGSYFIPYSRYEGYQTPGAKSYYQANTSTAEGANDRTATAFGMSSGTDFYVDLVHVNMSSPTTNAKYTFILAAETVATWTTAGESGTVKKFNFGHPGIRCIPNTSTDSIVQVVASNGTANTGCSFVLFAKGHYA